MSRSVALSFAGAGLIWPAFTHAATLSGGDLSLLWGVPFVGLLLSIALCPLWLPTFWHHHFGKVSAFWGLAFVLPCAFVFGAPLASAVVLHTLISEFVPFIVLLLALFTLSGGIVIRGNLHGSPLLNTSLLAIGTACASVMGTTGAAMLMIRPVLKANDNRRHNVHVVVFFIFLVANIGGGLTPLGDPPLFLGFLKGVSFGWTVTHMAAPVALASVLLLLLFFGVDSYYFRKEGLLPRDPTPDIPWHLAGQVNGLLLLGVVGAVLLSGMWSSGMLFSVLGVPVALEALVRDGLLLSLTGLSLWLTPAALRQENQFDWSPIKEVAKLFLGIFVAMIPALAMLQAGEQGAMAGLVRWVTSPEGQPINTLYFWMTGALSSFLDNAPTYLVFFNLAHGDATHLMTALPNTLTAISAGAVFMGANSYIGNAPNFMVKSIADGQGVAMPSFFGYMLWSGAILLPLFGVLTVVFF